MRIIDMKIVEKITLIAGTAVSLGAFILLTAVFLLALAGGSAGGTCGGLALIVAWYTGWRYTLWPLWRLCGILAADLETNTR